jgi:Ca2+/Na+ antiporter
MTQPSITKLVLSLWVTTILLLGLFSLIKQLLGTTHMFGGEFLWLFIAPAIVGWIYRKKYTEDITDDTAKRVSNYFVASILLLTLIPLFAYLSAQQSPRLSEQLTALVVALAIYFAILWFLGRWIVALGLRNYEHKRK